MNLRAFATTYCPPILRPTLEQIERSPIAVRLARGAFWSMAGAVISRGLMMVASILVARMLGKAGFGELGMIRSTVGMFGVFAGFGLGLTATKHVAEFRESDPERAGRIIGFSGMFALVTGGLMALGLYLFAPWLAEHTINAPHLEGVLRIGALILFINALNGAQSGALAGFEAFKSIAIVNLFVGLISFPILIGGAYLGGLTGAVWGLAINLGVNWLLNHLALRKESLRCGVPLTFQGWQQELPVLWRFSLPAVVSGAMVGPVIWICNAIFVNQEEGYVMLGIYMAAFQISMLISIANRMIGQAFLPICVSTLDKKSTRFEFVNIILPWAIGLACALPLLCVPELWVNLLGSEYSSQDMKNAVVFVAFNSIIIAHRQGIARNFVARNYLWWSCLGNSFWGGVAVLCAYCFRDYGGQGRAAAFTVAYGLNTLVFLPFYMNRKLCPRYILLSLHSILIWVTLVFLLAMNFYVDIAITYRYVIVLLSYGIVFFLFKKMWDSLMNPQDGEPDVYL